MSSIKQRKGKITFARELELFEDEKLFKLFFANFYPYDINRSFDIDYYCVSKYFDEVEPGARIPEYDIQFSRDNQGNYSIYKVFKK